MPITHCSNFFLEFCMWWKTLQPTVHLSEEEQLPNTKISNNTDWSCLYCAGLEGIVLIVLAVSWLLLEQENQGKVDIRLQKYVSDVDWAFLHLVTWVFYFGQSIAHRQL